MNKDSRLHDSHTWDYDPMYRCMAPWCLKCGTQGYEAPAKVECIPDNEVRKTYEQSTREMLKEDQKQLDNE